MRQLLWRGYRFLASGALAWSVLWMLGLVQISLRGGYSEGDRKVYPVDPGRKELSVHERLPVDNLSIPLNWNSSQQTKLVLRWTAFYGKSWGVDTGSGIFHNLGCPQPHCVLTDDRRRVDAADAILVHMRDIRHPDELPRSRKWQQHYVAYLLESPYNIHTNLTLFNGVFNWSSTYRLDSDLPSPYGSLLSLTNTTSNMSPKDHYQQEHAAWRRKSRLAAIFVSNCKSPTKREDYVDELRRLLPVDVYGACGQHKCLDAPWCVRMLERHYKFYLAFENSACLGYITEKFWHNALQHGTVPVVLGASRQQYEALAPPHSFIHTADFESPAQLARYLHRLDKDFQKYYEYREWTLHWQVRAEIVLKPNNSQMWCHLCEALHRDSPQHRVIEDLDAMWSVNAQCPDQHTIPRPLPLH